MVGDSKGDVGTGEWDAHVRLRPSANIMSLVTNPAGRRMRRTITDRGGNMWQVWAILSACFAALTAIFAKVGVASVNSDFATLIRTLVIIVVLAGIITVLGEWQSPATLSRRTLAFLVLSGLATGASWICYFRALKIGEAARVAPIDKLSVVLVAIFGVVFLKERLSGVSALGIALIAFGATLVAFAK